MRYTSDDEFRLASGEKRRTLEKCGRTSAINSSTPTPWNIFVTNDPPAASRGSPKSNTMATNDMATLWSMSQFPVMSGEMSDTMALISRPSKRSSKRD